MTCKRSVPRTASIALLLLAFVGDPAWADLDKGIAAYQSGDYAVALVEFNEAARKDDPVAQNMLGTMYVRGLATPRNDKMALDLFYRAQALGLPQAMANLGRMYALGLGTDQNNETALQYYRDAALAGFAPAILRMAEIYENGELDVLPDATLAKSWRARLGETPTEPGKARQGSVRTPSEQDRPSGGVAAQSPHRPGVLSRDEREQRFEKQVLQRLENYRQRERKLFVASADSRPFVEAYLRELRQRFRRMPALASAEPRDKIIVSLFIRGDGTVKSVELEPGSGKSASNRRVRSALNALTSLPPLPADILASADVLVVSFRLPIE